MMNALAPVSRALEGMPTPSASIANDGFKSNPTRRPNSAEFCGWQRRCRRCRGGVTGVVGDAELEVLVEQVDAAPDPDLELHALLLRTLGGRFSRCYDQNGADGYR
jgi:hypothetical protein